MVAISTPSIRILPPALSRMRNNAKVSDDLPAPVLPTIPICRNQRENDQAYKLRKRYTCLLQYEVAE